MMRFSNIMSAIISRVKCFVLGHDLSGSESIVETFHSINWIRKCNRCGRYIMHGDLGAIYISEKDALKFKKDLEEIRLLSAKLSDRRGVS